MSPDKRIPDFGYDPYPMTETDPATIDTQIADGLAETNGDVIDFLNNIGTLLPGELKRVHAEQYSLLNDPAHNPNDTSRVEFVSDRMRQVTWRQLFADVDQAILDAGLDKKEYRRLKELLEDAPSDDQAEVQEDLMEFLLKLYRQLRIQGYSHSDLRS